MMKDGKWLGLGYALLIVLFALSVVCVRKADQVKTEDWLRDEMTNLPSGKYLKPMTLGYTEAAASLLWVKGVLYFGEAYLTKQNYQWMNHILDIVTTLNPRFKEAYNFASTILTRDRTEIEKTLPLVERGLEQFPKEWQWRVSAALAQMRLDSNGQKAADYLRPIQESPEVPPHVLTLSASFLEKDGNMNLAISYLIRQYFNAESQMHQDIFLERLAKVGLVASATSDTSSQFNLFNKRKSRLAVVLPQMRGLNQNDATLSKLIADLLNHRLTPAAMSLLRSMGVPIEENSDGLLPNL